MRGVAEMLQQAQADGLNVEVTGDKLRFMGKKRHKPLIEEIASRKSEVITFFHAPRLNALAGYGYEFFPEENRELVSSETAKQPEGGGSPDCFPSRADEPIRWGGGQTRRLIGNGFPPHPIEAPDPRIIAAPVLLCQQCRSCRCLPELAAITGGKLCFTCWSVSTSEVRR